MGAVLGSGTVKSLLAFPRLRPLEGFSNLLEPLDPVFWLILHLIWLKIVGLCLNGKSFYTVY
jgi:hypothetical protein